MIWNIENHSTIFYAATILGISLVDFITLWRAKLRTAIQVRDKTIPEQRYSILIPIFGHIKYLKNVSFLSPYGEKVVLCTTTKESAEFNQALESIASEHGFRIYKSLVPLATATHKPNPWKLFHNTLRSGENQKQQTAQEVNREIARDEIIRDSFAIVKTPYCIFLDGDTVAEDNVDSVMGAFRDSGFDLSSVRVVASKQSTLAEKLQSIEYELAMDARKVYPWLTSGACMIAKTKVIQQIMTHHSLFFQGGDIEIGKLAKLLGFKVGHIASKFFTDVPETFDAWFRQRRAWSAGGFRHAVINAHKFSWKQPMFFAYQTIFIYGMTPIRWYEVVRHPIILFFVFFLYLFLVYIFHWKHRKWYFTLFPLYALFHVLIVIPLGIRLYFSMAYSSRNIGFIKFRAPVNAHANKALSYMPTPPRINNATSANSHELAAK